jgi:hypothetical protein
MSVKTPLWRLLSGSTERRVARLFGSIGYWEELAAKAAKAKLQNPSKGRLKRKLPLRQRGERYPTCDRGDTTETVVKVNHQKKTCMAALSAATKIKAAI